MNSPHLLDAWIGRTIGDRQRYRLDRRIGEGGMGYVFLAMDTLLGQPVALKLLRETLLGSGELRKRFEREVTLCAALHSSHIIQVTDYGVTAEGYSFYVMEYLQGETLGQLLRRKKRLSVEQTVGIISQICEGLHLAHTGVILWRDGATASEQIKVVHRDLKPDNIFLVSTALGELAKILDFGIAKIREDSSEYTNMGTNMFLGTYHYASPEQLEVAQDLDGRADIYSLGIILYEMLSGTDPFGLGLNVNKIDSMAWALAHTSKLPVPLRSQPGCEQLSLEVEAVVMRCLQKVPAERFASVDDLQRALQAAVTVGTGASDTTDPQQESRNQNTPQQLQDLGLREEILAATQVLKNQKHQQNLQQYEKAFSVAAYQKYPLNQNTRRELQQLGLRKEVKSDETIAEKLVEPTLPTKPKPNISPRLLRKATPVVVAAVVSALAYSTYQWQASRSTQHLNPSHTFDQQLLSSAQALANTSNFKDAIATASRIPPDSRWYSQAQSLLSSWSNHLLQEAQKQYQQAYSSVALEKALAFTTALPAHTSIAQTAQTTTAQWRREWQHNENYLQAAQSALQAGKWQDAIKQANQVRLLGQQVKQGSPYWQNKLKPIVARAEQLRAASQQTTYWTPPPVTYRNPSPVTRPATPPVTYHNPPPVIRYNPPPVTRPATPPVTYRNPPPVTRPAPPPVTYRNPPPVQPPQSQTTQSGWAVKRL